MCGKAGYLNRFAGAVDLPNNTALQCNAISSQAGYKMAPIIGVLLAAGSSKRFGSDKLMQAMPDGKPVAVHACRHLLAGVDGVVAVVRPGNEMLVQCLRDEGATVKICVDADQGMGASLAFGVGASCDAAAWLVALADMPWIAPFTICNVANALRAGAFMAAPIWQGRRGHPVGFSIALRSELMSLKGDVGARSVIQAHENQCRLIECDDPGVIRDIDHPDDLKHANDILCQRPRNS